MPDMDLTRTAKLAGVELNNLLWVRCGRDVEKTFMAADHIVQAKGFGCIWMDLGGLPDTKLRMVPKTYWYPLSHADQRDADANACDRRFADHRLQPRNAHTNVHASEPRGPAAAISSCCCQFDLRMRSRKGVFGPPLRMRAEIDYSDV